MDKKMKLAHFRLTLMSKWIEVANNNKSDLESFAEQLDFLRNFLFGSDELEKLLGIKK